jgi:hypothetical protein
VVLVVVALWFITVKVDNIVVAMGSGACESSFVNSPFATTRSLADGSNSVLLLLLFVIEVFTLMMLELDKVESLVDSSLAVELFKRFVVRVFSSSRDLRSLLLSFEWALLLWWKPLTRLPFEWFEFEFLSLEEEWCSDTDGLHDNWAFMWSS